MKAEGTNAIDYLNGVQDGYKKGIREVVEFVGENSREGNPYWHSLIDPKLLLSVKKWQAQLKEWGIEPEQVSDAPESISEG